eukprot:GILI01042976.1.p1 GENE.GILI01042976.1~~GILI01042976.1.p1  ORF type:complete len:378 (+),score=64.49 GILI01042976.1:102-1136(+)
MMSDEPAHSTQVESKMERKERKRKERSEEKKKHKEAADIRGRQVESHKQQLWAALQAIPKTLRNGVSVTPLITYGPFIRPYFVGYYADFRTLLHNASIVPRMVDIIVNPGSPLESIISRSAATRALTNDMLLRQAYTRVEYQLRAELHNFFLHYCMKGEVLCARSYCLAQAAPDSTADEDALYDIVMIVDCVDFGRLVERLKEAKHRGILKGHSSLSIVPMHDAPPFMIEGSTIFFEAEAKDSGNAYTPVDFYADERAKGIPSAANGSVFQIEAPAQPTNATSAPSPFAKAPRKVGAFVQMGQHATISTHHSADSIYADPTNQGTEAGSVAAQRFRLGTGAEIM